MESRKNALIAALRAFARQRPGLDFANYGDVSAYRAESRSITRDLKQAEELLGAVSWRDSITADSLLQAARGSFSGRLTITETPEGGFSIDYCTGQYFPTEYRRAVCSVLSSALWDYWRENMPVGEGKHEPHSNLTNCGDYIRKTARRELSRSVARRWFN